KKQQQQQQQQQQQLEEKSDIASSYGIPPPSNHNTSSRLAQIDDLKLFFATAIQQWEANQPLKRFVLPGGESVSCVLWNDLFFITGTDIVRSLTFRFHAFGRPVSNAKKFEEGIFSDLRNLKPGHDAQLEEPKSELLDMLYKNNCIRTQKKQKVFFWYSVPHDRLFLDALERDLKREKMGMEPTTISVAEPATSFSLDSTQELFDQLRKSMSQSAAATAQAIEQDMGNGPMPNTSLSLNHVADNNWSNGSTPWSASQSRLERAASQAKRSRVNSVPANLGQQQHFQLMQQKHHRMSHGSFFSANKPSRHSRTDSLTKDDYLDPISHGVDQLEITCSLSSQSNTSSNSMLSHNVLPSKSLDSNAIKKTKTIFGNLSLFDGSPTYKQRRRRAASVSSSALITSTSGGPERIRRHEKCHLRTPSTQPTINSHSSRLAMAAVKAGFAPNQIIQPTTMQMIQHTNVPNWSTSSTSSSADYACPLPTCGRLFKRADHLDRHMAALHSSSFVCNLCGKHFPRSENLALHHRREHEFDHHHASFNNNGGGGDNNDDDSSSPDDQRNSYNLAFQRRQVLNHQNGNNNNNSNGDTFYSSPRHSFDSSRSSGWSTGVVSRNGSASNSSSRCSTLSPMLDLDFDMTDIQQPSRSTNSLNTTDSSTVNTSFYQQQQQQQQQNDMYDSSLISNIVRSEDDFSSSSASSPCSTLQYDLKFNNNMTLLSPFKPIHPFTNHPHQQDMLQQQIMNQQVDEYQFVEDVSMLLTPTEYYAPYVDQQFTPFITSPDMNIVFGA
ncbi:hypothetical protein INT47_011307, partial [Mucor saturninus]